MKTRLVLNGSCSADARYETLRQLASAFAVPTTVVSSEVAFGQALRNAADDGYERVIIVGGDGTVSLAVNALAADHWHVELAIVPLGTGNDLARSLGLPRDDCQAAWQIAIDGAAVAVDVGHVHGQGQHHDDVPSYFINVANGAMAGLVASDVTAEDKSRWGTFAYWMAALSKLVDLQQFEVRLELDEHVLELSVYGLAIANGRFVGGGFPVAPQALLNDGLFDVIAIPVLPTLNLLGAGLDVLSLEKHSEEVLVYRSRSVHLRGKPEMPFSIDGEPVRPLNARFEVRSRAAKFVVGEQPPAVLTDDNNDAPVGEVT